MCGNGNGIPSGACVYIWKMDKVGVVVITLLGLLCGFKCTETGSDCSLADAFGRNCSLSCNCLEGCHDDGKCSQCSEGWFGPTCQLKLGNAALGKNATQGPTSRDDRPASLAVDGDVSGDAKWAYAYDETKTDNAIVWWSVDLGSFEKILNLKIVYLNFDAQNKNYERTLKRRRGHSVVISNASDPLLTDGIRCFHDDGQGQINATLHINCKGVARYVRIYTSRNESVDNTLLSRRPNLEIVEVEAYTDKGCSVGTYGDLCQQECGHCSGKGCGREDGYCTPCLTGWAGSTCLDKLCENCLNGNDSISGCKDSWYGVNCSQPCDSSCVNSTCDTDTGHCLACQVGWKGSFCNETCPVNCDNTGCKLDGTCNVCVNKTFHGDSCSEPCYTDCKGCFQNNGTCTSCQDGRYGDNCEKICSECDDDKCDRQGHCLTGCKDKRFYGAECDIECSSGIPNCSKCIAPKGTQSCFSCSSAKFGTQCEKDCPKHCELCDSLNKCTKCADGHNGTTCNCTIPNCLECDLNGYCATCVPGKFGQQCDKSCPGCETCKSGTTATDPSVCLTCRDHMYLNQSNGQCETCPWKCKKCTSRTECSECQIGYYSNDCGSACPNNCVADTTGLYVCEKQTGACSGDCEDGFYGEFCNISCYENCGTNTGHQGCNKLSGKCFSCKDGYYGEFCNMTCGINCVPASGKDTCDRDTGKCAQCKDMWYGNTCDKQCPNNCDAFCNKRTGKCGVCKSGFYGQYCNESCPIHCGPEPGTSRIVCNILNAECLHCKTGFYGERCTKYCESKCAYNGNAADCEKANGRCKGCLKGFFGDFCDSECTHCDDETCVQNTGHCVNGCDNGWYNSSCTERCSSTCKEEKCDQITGACLIGCIKGFTGQICKTRVDEPEGFKAFPVIIGVTVPIILILLCLLVFLMFRCRKSRGKSAYGVPLRTLDRNGRAENGEQHALIQPNGSTVNALPLPRKTPKNSSLSDDDLLEQDESAPLVPASTDPSDYYNLSWPIPVADFPAYVRNKKTENPFWYREDFANLPKGLLKKYNVAMELANKGKCRYKQLYPYDDNRVKLEPDGNMQSDFINASYINGYKNPQAYIAAQGPTDVNVADFWRMIWQKDCGKIVMLTNLFEECKMKCVRYWPDPEEHQDYGNLEVVLTSENVYPDYTLRQLTATHKDTREEKDFMHFHFTAWPDRGVPDNPSCMLNFHTKVMEDYGVPDGPILVHCSAGIGRTGTFVALDFLLNRAAKETHIDVFRTITDMRYQRTNFVQTDVQYDFLHNAIAEALTTKEMEVHVSEFCKHYWSLLEVDGETGKTKLQEQFEALNQMSPVLDTSSYQAGNKEENICKSRYPDILPVDMYRAYLSTPTKGSNEYVNAVFLPTALNKTGFLLTQMPLPHTVTDFWRLVYDQHVSTIVMMNNIDDNDDSIGEYWPSDDCTYGPFKVELLSCENFEEYSLLTIKLTYSSSNRQNSMVVKQYRYEGWSNSDPVPNNTFSLTALIGTVTMAANNHVEKSTIVHCMNGAERSGLYCVLSAIFERLQSEQKVNIPQTILNWQSRRPQIIHSLEQFDFCYKAVAEYLDSQQIYSNVL